MYARHTTQVVPIWCCARPRNVLNDFAHPTDDSREDTKRLPQAERHGRSRARRGRDGQSSGRDGRPRAASRSGRDAARGRRAGADDDGASTPRRAAARATPTCASAAIASNFVFTREQQIVNVVDTDSIGAGVRALVDGTWGFAATQPIDEGRRRRRGARGRRDREGEPRSRATSRSSSRPSAVHQGRDVEERLHDRSVRRFPIEQKADLLLKANAAAMKAKGVQFVNSADCSS